MKSIYKIKGVVQHYSWGGTDFIPRLLDVDNTGNKPFAEYWLGAHSRASATHEGTGEALDKLIAGNPQGTLGLRVAEAFNTLPYLFKILDVSQMLSIQVHPSKTAAEQGFERENEKGTPIDAANRNYKDKNHKPEMMVALGDFWLLHGFKSEAQVLDVLNRVPELNFLLPVFGQGNYKALYEEVMTMPQERVDAVLSPLLQRIVPAYQANELRKDSEDFWAARAALTFCKNGTYDRGIFSVYLFNLLHLQEGEAIYQPAGLPHAYLEGQNVEVMANSDNVLRAGLTEKHVDVPELMKHVIFEATIPDIIRKGQAQEQDFSAPVREFHLKRYQSGAPIHLSPETAAIGFVMDGAGLASAGEERITVKKGEALLFLPGSPVAINPSGGAMTLFYVSAPVDKI